MGETAVSRKRLHLLISGMVQGVWYRASAKDKAEVFYLTGWVRNLPDGRVEVVAEGDEENLKQFMRWAWDGPPMAAVIDIRALWEPYTGEFDTFNITE